MENTWRTKIQRIFLEEIKEKFENFIGIKNLFKPNFIFQTMLVSNL